MRAKLSLALLLAVFATHPALAADPKPDAAIKTKAIEANVYLDNRIKADPDWRPIASPTARSGWTRMPRKQPPR